MTEAWLGFRTGFESYTKTARVFPNESGKTTFDARGSMTCYSGIMVLP